MVRIAIIMTCHNRRALTETCLRLLVDQPLFEPANLFLVDDGSTDGTADAVRAICPGANVIQGSGDLFWNGGMRLAWDKAREAGGFDYYFWLNDDVALYSGALVALVEDVSRAGLAGKPVVMSGSTVTPGSTQVSYGGQSATSRLHPLRLRLVQPQAKPVPVDTFSGNVVLISAEAERSLGNLSPSFKHIYGDLDYGLRAKRAGVPGLLSSAISGECATNESKNSSIDISMSRLSRLRTRLREEKKVHARDWRRFARLHSGLGPLSFLYSASPYLRLLINRP